MKSKFLQDNKTELIDGYIDYLVNFSRSLKIYTNKLMPKSFWFLIVPLLIISGACVIWPLLFLAGGSLINLFTNNKLLMVLFMTISILGIFIFFIIQIISLVKMSNIKW
ncbi:MAG: hypothetical protein KAW56_08125 [Candidatus Marinimicrobia bacterium]|nr:hypothetical protein [Candidatus Neomarinimicrobiota bacterium]